MTDLQKGQQEETPLEGMPSVDNVLPEAPANVQDLLVTPEAPEMPDTSDDTEDVIYDSNDTEVPRSNRRRKVIIAVGAVAAAATLATVISLWPKGSGTPPPANTPSASAPATPVSTPTPETTAAPDKLAEQIALHELKPNSDRTVVAKDILKELTNWEMSGSDTVVNAWVAYATEHGDASDAAFSTFLDQFSADQAKIYAPALFGPDYASNPDIQDDIKGQIKLNRETLQNILATKQNKETLYERSINYDSLGDGSSADGQTLQINYTDSDNAGQGNSVPSNLNDSGVLSINDKTVGDRLIITSMHYQS